jgi:hypothetical protein
MIRVDTWGGWVSYASPYKLPPGAAVEQINMCCLLPGQLQARGGMELAMTTTGAVQEAWGYSVGPNTDKVFIFTNSGEILIEDAPNI